MSTRDMAETSLADAVLAAGLAVAEDRARWLVHAGFYEVRSTDWPVLWLLQAGPMSVGQLAEPLEVTQQAASKAVASLEQRGYISRTRHAEDSRRRVVHLTEDGRAVLSAASAWDGDHQCRAVAQWGADDVHRTTAMLDTLAASIEHEPGPGRNLRSGECADR